MMEFIGWSIGIIFRILVALGLVLIPLVIAVFAVLAWWGGS
jgi:hypothetical protein